MKYICTFEDEGGNQISILSTEVDSEREAILEVGERLKEISPGRAWKPLHSEVRESDLRYLEALEGVLLGTLSGRVKVDSSGGK